MCDVHVHRGAQGKANACDESEQQLVQQAGYDEHCRLWPDSIKSTKSESQGTLPCRDSMHTVKMPEATACCKVGHSLAQIGLMAAYASLLEHSVQLNSPEGLAKKGWPSRLACSSVRVAFASLTASDSDVRKLSWDARRERLASPSPPGAESEDYMEGEDNTRNRLHK